MKCPFEDACIGDTNEEPYSLPKYSYELALGQCDTGYFIILHYV